MRQAAFTILLLLSPPAYANEAKIVLLSLGTCCPDEAWPDAEAKAVQELQGFDFTVEVVEGTAVSEKDRRIELLETAASHDAICALRIVKLPEGGGVDLWIIDRVTGKMVYRQIPLSQDPESASIVALRVVELLRASLLELELPDVTPQINPPPAPALQVVRDRLEKPEGPFGLLTGASIIGSPGGLGDTGIQGAINWMVNYRPIPPLAVELEGLISFASRDIHDPVRDMTSTFDLAAVRAWLLWFIRPTGIVRPILGAGGGLLIPWSTKKVSSQVKKAHALVGYVGGTAMLVFAITRNLWIRTSFKVGVAAPSVSIRFNGTEVATFGDSLIEGQLLLELRIP